MKNRDVIFSRIIFIIVVIIVSTWIWDGIGWLWNWFTSASESGSIGSGIWNFCKQNISILVVVYGIICLQVSGISELKFEKNFLMAFILAIFLTPPIMMAVYGHRRNRGDDSKEKI